MITEFLMMKLPTVMIVMSMMAVKLMGVVARTGIITAQTESVFILIPTGTQTILRTTCIIAPVIV
jgi:hypothetical protein